MERAHRQPSPPHQARPRIYIFIPFKVNFVLERIARLAERGADPARCCPGVTLPGSRSTVGSAPPLNAQAGGNGQEPGRNRDRVRTGIARAQHTGVHPAAPVTCPSHPG